MMRNAAAALVAIVCWAGLAVQLSATLSDQHHVLAALWVLARFFTVLTNLLAALVMSWIAIGRRAPPELFGLLTVSLILVGLVYLELLQGLDRPNGPAHVADILLHKLSPVLMALWWLLFAPRARLRWSAPLWWVLYPACYFAYVLVRARYDGRYPYPFMDAAHIGWLQTALNAGGIALGFMLLGLVIVWIDGWRPLGSSRANG